MSSADQADTLHTQPDQTLAAECAPEQPDTDTLHAQIIELQAEIKNVQARAAADMYNFQKRMERDTDNANPYALD